MLVHVHLYYSCYVCICIGEHATVLCVAGNILWYAAQHQHYSVIVLYT